MKYPITALYEQLRKSENPQGRRLQVLFHPDGSCSVNGMKVLDITLAQHSLLREVFSRGKLKYLNGNDSARSWLFLYPLEERLRQWSFVLRI